MNSNASYTPPLSASLDIVLLDGNDHELRRTIHNLFSTGQMLEELRAIMGDKIGLTGRQYQILMVIARGHDGRGVSIKEVASQLRVASSHVTVEVGKLVRIGYVHKIPNAEDRRSVLVALTAQGTLAIETVTPVTAEVNDGLFAGFSREEFNLFRDLLEKFTANADGTLATAHYQNSMESRRTGTDD